MDTVTAPPPDPDPDPDPSSVIQPSGRRDAARNRERVLAAAQRLLDRNGAAGLTMDAVAAEAGVGKGTLFRGFGDRDGMIRKLIDEQLAEFLEAFESGPPPLGPGATPIQRLEAFLTEMIVVEDRHVELLLAAGNSYAVAQSDIYLTMQTHLKDLLELLDPELDPHVMSALLLGAVAPPVLLHLRRELGLSVMEVQRAALSLLRGVGPPSARRS